MGVFNKFTVDFDEYYNAFIGKIESEDADNPPIDKSVVLKFYHAGCDTDEAVLNYIEEVIF